MVRKTRKKSDPFDGRRGTPSHVAGEGERGEGLGEASFAALFDGTERFIVPETDLTPVTWVVRDDDWVPVEGTDKSRIEGPSMNWVLRDLSPSEVAAYGIERGWSALAVHVQCVAELFGLSVKDGNLICEQRKGTNSSKYVIRCPIDHQL